MFASFVFIPLIIYTDHQLLLLYMYFFLAYYICVNSTVDAKHLNHRSAFLKQNVGISEL